MVLVQWSKPVLSAKAIESIVDKKRLIADTRGVNRIEYDVATREIPVSLTDMIQKDAQSRLPPSVKRFSIKFHLLRVLPGANDQEMHQDNGTNRFYWTYSVPLTRDTPEHGFTRFRHHPDIRIIKRGCMVAWDGREYHQGLANRASSPRIFLFASVFSGKDYNDETY